MSYDKCPFCDMGQAKRTLIWRLTNNLSRGEITDLLKKNKKRKSDYVCHKCGKICGNAGMLAIHMKSPGRPYRRLHKKFDEKAK